MYYIQSHTIELADVAPQTIWAILSDPQTHHPRWDERVSSVRLEGPFADGTVQWIAFDFAREPVKTVLVDVIEGVGYSDDVEVFGLDGRFTHRKLAADPRRVRDKSEDRQPGPAGPARRWATDEIVVNCAFIALKGAISIPR